MKRFTIVAFAAVLVLAGTGCQIIRPTGAPSGRTPVVFVHGWNGSESTWDEAVDQFLADGYAPGDITVLYYGSSLSAADAADILADEVDHLLAYTGASKVDVVSHSFGSMVTRYCVSLGDCAGKVDHWSSLAGADNGTSLAGLCLGVQASCQDMSGQTSTIADLQAAWGAISAQGIEVQVQWSSGDGVIIPATNSQNPPPAVNVEVPGSLGHNDIPADSGVISTTLAFFAD